MANYEYEYEVTRSRVLCGGIGVQRPEIDRLDAHPWDLVDTTFGVVDGVNYIFFTWRRKYGCRVEEGFLSEAEYLEY